MAMTGTDRTATGGSESAAFVHRMQTTLLESLRAELGGASDRWVVLDFPSQLNCGDSAIWLGEAAAARALGARIVRAVDRINAVSARVRDDDVVLLHGGGNFGGLYSTHERLRLDALRRFRGRRLIQLPQSVEWASPDALEAIKRAVGQHGDFLLHVRDRRSYERATAELDCEVRLVPDAAFALGALQRGRPTTATPLVQRRTDREAASAADVPGDTFDWLQAPASSTRSLALRGALRAFGLSRRLGGRDVRVDSLLAGALARANLRFARRSLSSAPVVVTDRLHGHVISTLLGVEHCVVDDAHGKIRALWDTWTHEAPSATFVPDWATARTWLQERSAHG